MSNIYKDAMREGSDAYEVAMRKADNDHRVAMENAVAAYRAAKAAYENRPQEVKDAEFQEAVESAAAKTALANAAPYVQDTDLAAIESRAQNRYDRLLYRGGAGSPKAHAAYAEWMAARTARAAQDAELEAENKRLRSEIEALVSEGYPITQPAPDLTLLESRAQNRFDRILYRGGAGSPKAHAAYAEWMAARTARAAQDAQDATKASEGHTGIKPALAIDWRNVGPLNEPDRTNPNEPSYLHIPF